MIEEISRSDVDKLVGACSKTVSSKLSFIEFEKQYQVMPWLDSNQYRNNYKENKDSIAEFLEPEHLSRLDTDLEKAALDVGVAPVNQWDGEDPLSSPLYLSILDIVINEAKTCLRDGYDYMDKNQIPVTFNITSSTGYSSLGDDFDCTYDVINKNKLLDHYTANQDDIVPSVTAWAIIGYRLQVDTAEKADHRPSFRFEGDKFSQNLVHDKVFNPHHGYRVRHVVGFPWFLNIPLIAMSACIFQGIENGSSKILKNAWKFTHDSIEQKFVGKVVFATDISNNDIKFPHTENVYIHKELMGDYFEWWDKFDQQGGLIGGYVDKDQVNRYYKIMDELSILLSGEGLTSIINKIKHTTMQFFNHCLTYYQTDDKLSIEDMLKKKKPHFKLPFDLKKEANPKELLTGFSEWMQNNGDDTLDGFETKEIMEVFKDIALSNPFAVVGEEPPSFSGIGILVDSDNRMIRVYSLMKSLFIKGMETERRNFDSKLGYLPYNAVKGKVDFMMQYSYDDNMYMEACDLFMKLRGIDLRYDQLEKAALEELIAAEKNNDRSYFINRLALKLGETDSSKIYYKYTTEDLIKADKEAFENLFIHRPISDLLKKDKLAK